MRALWYNNQLNLEESPWFDKNLYSVEICLGEIRASNVSDRVMTVPNKFRLCVVLMPNRYNPVDHVTHGKLANF
jgi:hypothetical protein